MSVMKTCTCSRDNYRVSHRNHNHSYFETPKGGAHYSDYSEIVCLACGWRFRTKTKWSARAPDLTQAEDDDLRRRNPAPKVEPSRSRW